MLTHPSVETLGQLARTPQATGNRAHLWIFLSALAGAVLASLVSAFVGALLDAPPVTRPTSLDLLMLSPVVALFELLLFVIITNLLILIARALGGKGVYSRLAYALSTFISPLILISSVLSAIPVVNATNMLTALYGLGLTVVALRAITRLNWGKAVLTLALALGVVLALGACFIIAVLPLLLQGNGGP